ncbi:MAG: methylglyoxal synthase [Lachnospiraceae bacterium]
MVQFCIAYCGILAEHSICATTATGGLDERSDGPADLTLYLHDKQGTQQIGARIAYNEIDLVLCFCDPANPEGFDSVNKLSRLCDQHLIPMATNAATAEVLIQGLRRGDLDWRDIVNPKKK